MERFIRSTGILLSFLMASLGAYAQSPINPFSTIEGRLFNGGTPYNTDMDIRLELLHSSNAACVLYAEDHLNYNVSSADAEVQGRFSVRMGDGTTITGTTAGIAQAFGGRTVNGDGPDGDLIAGDCSVTAAGGYFEVRVSVTESTNPGAYTALNPPVRMTSVPQALAAESVQGRTAADLIQVRDDAGTDLNQSNVETVFSATNYARLIQLLGNTFTAGFSFNNQRVTNVAAPTAGTDAVNRDYVDGHVGDKVADLSGVGAGTNGGHTLIWDAGNNRWTTGVPSALDNTKLALTGGTVTGPVTFSGNIFSSHITMNNQTLFLLGRHTNAQEGALGLGVGDEGRMFYNTELNALRVWDGTQYIGFGASGAAGGALAGSYPNPTIGTGVVTSDNITDGTIATDDLADSSITPLKLGSPGAGRIAISNGTNSAFVFTACAEGEVLQWSTGTGWGCGTGALINGTNLRGVNVSTTTPTSNQVLKYNGSAWAPATDERGVTHVGMGLGFMPGDINGSGTIHIDVGVTDGQIVQVDTGDRLPVIDGSQLTNINAVQIQSQPVSVVAPTIIGQVLKWNGSAWEAGTDIGAGGADASSLRGFNISTTTPTPNQVLRYNGSAWEAVTLVDNVGTGTISFIASGNGLSGGPITTTGTISVNAGTAPNQIVQLDGTSRLPAVDGSQVTNIANLRGQNVATTTPNPGQVLKYNGSAWEAAADTDSGITALSGDITASGSGPVAATILDNRVLTRMLDNSAIGVNRIIMTDAVTGNSLTYADGCTPGQVLKWVDSANGWACAGDIGATGVVTLVAGGTGTTGGSITGTGTINVDVGIGNNQVLQLNGSAQIPAVDGSLLTFVNAATIRGENVATTTPTLNQVLRYNGTAWEPFTLPAGASSGTQGQIQFAGVAAGTFNASANLHWDNTNNRLGILNGGPSYALHVGTSAGSTQLARFEGPVEIRNNAAGSPTNLILSNLNNTGSIGTAIELNGYSGGARLSAKIESGMDGTGWLGSTRFLIGEYGTWVEKMRIHHKGNVGIGTSNPNAGAVLDIHGTGNLSAIIVPRATTGDRPITAANGMIRYNTSLAKFEVYEDDEWVNMVSTGGGGDFLRDGSLAMTGNLRLGGSWLSNDGGGEGIRVDNTGNVGVGSASPSSNLDIYGNSAGIVGSWVTNANTSGTSGAQLKLASGAGGTNGDAFVTYDLPGAATWSTGVDASDGRSFKFNLSGSPSLGGTMMVVTTGGFVGIGTTVPRGELNVVSSSTSAYRGISSEQISGSTQGALFSTLKARGTPGSPTVVNVNDTIGGLVGFGYTGGGTDGYESGAQINFRARTGFAPATRDTAILFQTAYGNTMSEKMRIEPNGRIGIGTDTPLTNAILDIYATGALSTMIIPRGTTADRVGFGTNGMIRFNTDTAKFEVYEGSWTQMVQTAAGSYLPLTGGNLTGPLQVSSGTVMIGTASPIYEAGLTTWRSENDTANGFYSGTFNQFFVNPAGGHDGTYYASNTLLSLSPSGSGTGAAIGSMVAIDKATPHGLAAATGVKSFLNMVGGGGNVTNVYGMESLVNLGVGSTDVRGLSISMSGGGSATQVRGISIDAAMTGATDAYGVYISDISGTNQYGIYQAGANDTNYFAGRVGIGTNSPATGALLDLNGTGALLVPRGTTADRSGFGANGMIRYNTNLAKFEVFEAGSWTNMVTPVGGDFMSNGTVPMTGNLRAAAGAVGSPSYTFSGDTDTGIWNSGAGNIALSTNGNQVLTVGSVGIGIGTTTTTRYMTINSSLGNSEVMRVSMNGTGSFRLNHSVTDDARLAMSNGSSVDSISLNTRGDSWLAGGRVGIGTNAPNTYAVLDVVGTGAISSMIVPRGTNAERTLLTAQNGMIRYNTNSSSFEVFENATWKNVITSGSAMSIDALSDGKYLASDSSLGLGANALQSNTAGGQNNTAVGADSLYTVIAGDNNTAVGAGSLYATTGNSNTALGVDSGLNISSGSDNVAIGHGAASLLTSGSGNIAIGSNVELDLNAGSNQMNIGNTLYGIGVNTANSGRVGIGTSNPNVGSALDVFGTGNLSSMLIPRGTTAERPISGINGMIRYNSARNKFEVYENGWSTSITADHKGTTIFPGNIAQKVVSDADANLDFNQGPIIISTFACGTYSLSSIREGGSYTIINTNTGTGACNFNTTVTGDDNGTVTYRWMPASGNRLASSHTIYNLFRAGNVVYITWTTGFN